ncbi:hypothetical protein [Nocardia sp. NPDC004604]|uniref:hypothetical protein n=1 Tax=Nocardia sp. NPDC004604 TaxID=3157013 RepID=UPI0033B81910
MDQALDAGGGVGGEMGERAAFGQFRVVVIADHLGVGFVVRTDYAEAWQHLFGRARWVEVERGRGAAERHTQFGEGQGRGVALFDQLEKTGRGCPVGREPRPVFAGVRRGRGSTGPGPGRGRAGRKTEERGGGRRGLVGCGCLRLALVLRQADIGQAEIREGVEELTHGCFQRCRVDLGGSILGLGDRSVGRIGRVALGCVGTGKGVECRAQRLDCISRASVRRQHFGSGNRLCRGRFRCRCGGVFECLGGCAEVADASEQPPQHRLLDIPTTFAGDKTRDQTSDVTVGTRVVAEQHRRIARDTELRGGLRDAALLDKPIQHRLLDRRPVDQRPPDAADQRRRLRRQYRLRSRPHRAGRIERATLRQPRRQRRLRAGRSGRFGRARGHERAGHPPDAARVRAALLTQLPHHVLLQLDRMLAQRRVCGGLRLVRVLQRGRGFLGRVGGVRLFGLGALRNRLGVFVGVHPRFGGDTVVGDPDHTVTGPADDVTAARLAAVDLVVTVTTAPGPDPGLPNRGRLMVRATADNGHQTTDPLVRVTRVLGVTRAGLFAEFRVRATMMW